MASFAIYILTLSPALFEETAALALTTILSAVFNILMPLLPFMFVPTICTPAGIVLHLLFLGTFVLSHLPLLIRMYVMITSLSGAIDAKYCQMALWSIPVHLLEILEEYVTTIYIFGTQNYNQFLKKYQRARYKKTMQVWILFEKW